MATLRGVWIEGPGYEVRYGIRYDACAKRCLEQPKCVMLEYYRPKNKCNLYDGVRGTQPGGASDVAVKR